jgi:hypothetical protein
MQTFINLQYNLGMSTKLEFRRFGQPGEAVKILRCLSFYFSLLPFLVNEK